MIKDKQGAVRTLLLPVSLSGMLLLSGCGGTFGDKDTDEAKKYEASQAIDSGNFDKAIKLLEKDCAGFSYAECQLNLGQAYLGKAGFDVISLGRDMMAIEGNDNYSDTDKEIQTTSLLFEKLFDPQLTKGIRVFKRLLDNNGTECNSVQYDTLTTTQKQACIAINPILLMEKLSDSTVTSENTVDLETIIQFKSIVDAAIPGLTTEEFVDVVSGGTAIQGTEKDVNDNGTPDQLEITDCVIKALNGDNSACTSAGVAFQDLNETDVTIGGTDYNVTRVTMTSTTTYPNKSSARLWVTQPLGATTVTLDEGNVTSDAAGATSCTDSATVTGCYPVPLLDENGDTSTFNDVAVNIINDDSVIASIAELSDTSDTTTSQEKVDNLKTDICGTADCTATQEDVLLYMSTDK